ncbi:hypothetical protein BBJ28_00005475 [Nothophytophthora sp. Chile5]|nr:hypothetical protein BBJ28_00005475 [Nothophytophthora sp. Chile5]
MAAPTYFRTYSQFRSLSKTKIPLFEAIASNTLGPSLPISKIFYERPRLPPNVRVASRQMATVRTTAPRGSDGKRKRKRSPKPQSSAMAASAGDGGDAAALRGQLETLENWQRAITIDMKELRKECLKVRRELEKLDDVAESAVEQAERCADQAASLKERTTQQTTANDAALEQMTAKLEAVEVSTASELLEVKKKLTQVDKKLQKQTQSAIDEDFLMTQLTALQEQYDSELAKLREEQTVAMRAKQRQVESMERLLQTSRDEHSRLAQRVGQLPSRKELDDLQQQLEELERVYLDDQTRTRAGLEAMQHRVVELNRHVGDVDARASSQPPLPPPHALVRPGEVAVLHDELRRVNRDLHAVSVDFAGLSKRVDDRGDQQSQQFELRVQDLSGQVFDALGSDSRLHATEIRRLKDAMFDLQSGQREAGQRMRRLEDERQQVAASMPLPPPRGPGGFSEWHRGAESPLLPPPLPDHSFERAPRPSHPFDGAPPGFRGHSFESPLPPNRTTWPPRRRSRSRSPIRRPPLREEPPRTELGTSNLRRFEHNNQRQPLDSNDEEIRRRDSRANNGGIPASSTQLPRQGSGDGGQVPEAPSHAEEPPRVPFRRNRPSRRRNPEVIVIEEDEDDEEEALAPDRAPPDVVLDEEEASDPAADVIMTSGDGHETQLGATDRLERDADLHTGFLLYFCLGGAPDLEPQWTSSFSELKAEDCVAMPRALGFQRRYSCLQNFPVYLTQCILQAVIVNGQAGGTGEAEATSLVTGGLNAASLRTEFNKMVKDVRLSWGETLLRYLAELFESMETVASEPLQLAMNPAILPLSIDQEEVQSDEWSRQQATAMWTLAHDLHYGSVLPSLASHPDASPAVYLFALMFDVLSVTSECPESGSYRLNVFGEKLVRHLWHHLLQKLPYVFFADWSWLDAQSSKGKLPPLGFCHLLASILLWNSAMERDLLMRSDVYVAAIDLMLTRLRVDGKPVSELSDSESDSLLVGESESSTRIELVDVDNTFALALGMDALFEVSGEILSKMQAALLPVG